MILPILISVSVAPVSYFFCANAPLLVAMSTTTPAEKATSRDWIAAIAGLPDVVAVPFSLIGSLSSFKIHSIPLARDQQDKTCPTEVRGIRPSDKAAGSLWVTIYIEAEH